MADDGRPVSRFTAHVVGLKFEAGSSMVGVTAQRRGGGEFTFQVQRGRAAPALGERLVVRVEAMGDDGE